MERQQSLAPLDHFRLHYPVIGSGALESWLMQGATMFSSFNLRRGLIAGFVSVAIGLGACDQGDSGPDDADQETAVEDVAAASREHGTDSVEPSAGAQVAPQVAVRSERLPYAEVDNELVYGHFAFPEDMIEPLPAVIVIHEWWGLNENVRAMADRLAGEGYIVLAVDLFGGDVADSPGPARQLMLSVVEDPDAAVENLRQAYDFLDATAGAPRIGTLGWSFGGGWALNAAIMLPDELDATVIFYGQVTDDEDKLRPVNAPILGLFGDEDTAVSIESVRNFEAALIRLRKEHEIHIYPEAGHHFANPADPRYDAEAADDAWGRVLQFLDQNLLSGDDAS